MNTRLLLVLILVCGLHAGGWGALADSRPRVLVREVSSLPMRGAGSKALDQPGDCDCNSPAHWEGDTLFIFNSSGHPWRSSGSDLLHLDKDYRRCEYDRPASGGRWIECTWKAESGVLYGWYHQEPTGLLPGKPLTVPRIGAVRSTNNGATWQDLGVILEAPTNSWNPATTNFYFAGGHGDFSAMRDASAEYVYFFFSTYGREPRDQGVAVARMRWSDRDQPVGKVWKWREGRWTEPGLGGEVTPYLAVQRDWHRSDVDAYWGPSIHWNTHLGQYVILLNRAVDRHWKQEGIYVSFNTDLANPAGWTVPEKILGSPGDDRWYPQVIGSDKARGETDKLASRTARLFVRGLSRWEMQFLRPGEAVGATP